MLTIAFVYDKRDNAIVSGICSSNYWRQGCLICETAQKTGIAEEHLAIGVVTGDKAHTLMGNAGVGLNQVIDASKLKYNPATDGLTVKYKAQAVEI